MTLRTKDGREVEITHIEAEYGEGVYHIEGECLDGSELSDSDIDYLLDTYGDDLYQDWYERRIDMAEYAMDQDR